LFRLVFSFISTTYLGKKVKRYIGTKVSKKGKSYILKGRKVIFKESIKIKIQIKKHSDNQFR